MHPEDIRQKAAGYNSAGAEPTPESRKRARQLTNQQRRAQSLRNHLFRENFMDTHRQTKQMYSLSDQLHFFTRLIIIILMIPAVAGLLVTAFYTVSFQRSVSLMGRVAALRPVVEDEIPEQLWSVIAGRSSFEESGVNEAIKKVDDELDDFLKQVPKDSSTRVSVIRRTMNTLSSYAEQIEQEMADPDIPVTTSESTLEEVRSVSILVGNMLEDFIEDEVLEVYRKTQSFQTTVRYVIDVGVFLLIGALLVTGWAARRQTQSIHSAIGSLEQFTRELASGNLQARVDTNQVEELAGLTRDVNAMASQLEALVEQNRLEQENLKKAELRTLQAQINPHFLYNTLDTIVWQAQSGKNEEVVAMTKSLSDFFRNSLSSGEDWVTVEQELRHLKGYLSIQKTRYRDILNYEVEADPEMNNHMILKLLLQPLVENALYHGIKYKRGGGTISVRGFLQDNMLCFEVRDTGNGMTPERLEEVREAMRLGRQMHRDPNEPEPGGGFGLYNVDQRIRLYYNLDHGLQIESGPEGTAISFKVPALAGKPTDG